MSITNCKEVHPVEIKEYISCNLCNRKCGVNRYENVGFCRMPADVYITRASLHRWEEPPISGTQGSGTIFLSGCSLRCVFCQNREISRGLVGEAISVDKLAEIMLNLESQGAHNINFVTPTHYAPTISEATKKARAQGLKVPIVYNTGSFDTVETIRSLDGVVDIYLPDLKYYKNSTSKKYSEAETYVESAKAAIDEMYRQVGTPVLNDSGLLVSGVVVRILLLPGHLAEAKLTLKYLVDTYGDGIYVSLMNQYTPMPGMPSPLNRRVTHSEYEELLNYAEKLGLKNGFYQDYGTASESFIPSFDGTGINV